MTETPAAMADEDLFWRAKALFLELRGLPALARAERLAAAEPGLRREVESLLSHHRPSEEGFDESSLADAVKGAVQDMLGPQRLPERLGHFRILRAIGEGGMGVVYEAEQEDPRRRVALKVIRPGMVTRSLLQRFRHEAQVLAQLKHPGIAQIYEAGTSDTGAGGQPFFAMELVAGRPLLEHAATLRPPGRLELVARVCDAHHHAHQKGVIHRDLKPANILVEPGADELGQPKILDFGVARATDADMQTVTMRTDVGQLVGTVPYMSPEQAAGDPADLDFRSDIYSLGIIAYELLAGRLPYPVQGKLIHEAVRVIREEEASRLSSVSRVFRGDVETIIAKALEKDKERRYQSAAELAADIRRHLRDEPIVARPASALYQWRKFARRNKGLVAAVGVIFAVLLISTVVSLRLLVLARAAREDAQTEADVARIAAAASLIDGGDPASARATLYAIPAERRNWEWRYNAGRLDQSIVRIDVGEPLSAARFSSDGAGIIAASSSGTISLWSTDGNGPRSTVALTAESLGPVVLDRDGARAAAATGSGERLVVWETADGRPVAEHGVPVYPGASRTWTRVALGPPEAGRIVFSSGNRDAFLLDAVPGREQVIMHDEALDVAMSSDGRRIALGLNEGLALFDATTAERLLFMQQPDLWESWVVEFIGRGYGVAVGARKRLLVCDPDRPDAPKVLRGHSGVITAIASDESGRWLASGSADTTVCVWDLSTPAPPETLRGHTDRVTDLAFCADGSRLLSCSADGTVRLWNREPDDRLTVLRGHESFVYPVAFSGDGRRIVSGSWDGDLRVWDTVDGTCIAVIPTGEQWVASMAIAPDDSCIVTGHPGGRMRVHDAATGVLIGTVDLPTPDTVNSLAFDPESSDLLVRSVRWLRIIRRPAALGDGASAADWILRSPIEVLMEDPWTERDESAVACAPARPHIAVARTDGPVVILDRESGREIHRLEPPEARRPCFSLAFSPDGAWLAAGFGEGSILLMDTASGELIRTMTGHQAHVYALAFSPDGSRLASGSDDTSIRLWDPQRGTQVALLAGHDDYVFSLAFSPDGSMLASGSGDTTVRLWDTRPVHERVRAGALMQAARAAAQPKVEALLAALAGPGEVAAAIRADVSLDAMHREAALQVLLGKAAARGAGSR